MSEDHDDRPGHFLHCLFTLYDAVNEVDEDKQSRALWMLNIQTQNDHAIQMITKMREDAKVDYESFWERDNGRSS